MYEFIVDYIFPLVVAILTLLTFGGLLYALAYVFGEIDLDNLKNFFQKLSVTNSEPFIITDDNATDNNAIITEGAIAVILGVVMFIVYFVDWALITHTAIQYEYALFPSILIGFAMTSFLLGINKVVISAQLLGGTKASALIILVPLAIGLGYINSRTIDVDQSMDKITNEIQLRMKKLLLISRENEKKEIAKLEKDSEKGLLKSIDSLQQKLIFENQQLEKRKQHYTFQMDSIAQKMKTVTGTPFNDLRKQRIALEESLENLVKDQKGGFPVEKIIEDKQEELEQLRETNKGKSTAITEKYNEERETIIDGHTGPFDMSFLFDIHMQIITHEMSNGRYGGLFGSIAWWILGMSITLAPILIKLMLPFNAYKARIST